LLPPASKAADDNKGSKVPPKAVFINRQKTSATTAKLAVTHAGFWL
jgi:hypothetical protein